MLELSIKNSGITEPDYMAYTKKIQEVIQTMQKKDRGESPLQFLDLPNDNQVIAAVQEFANDQKGKFTDILILGIGGSSLGGMTLLQSLKPLIAKTAPRMHFLSNVDPDEMHLTLEKLNLKKTLTLVISKSGETTETLATFFVILEKLQKVEPKFWKKNLVIITDPHKGFLNDFAREHEIPRFSIPPFVGGRYSVLSPVGLLPAALAGINIKKITDAVKSLEKIWTDTNIKKNYIAKAALITYLADKKLGKKIHVLFPYNSQLSYFGDWYIQLFAESLGKNFKIGPQPVKAVGTVDQHSQIQLFMEGPNDRFFTFIHVKNFNHIYKIPEKYLTTESLKYLKKHSLNDLIEAEQKATEAALAAEKRPSMTLHIDTLDAAHIGMLFYAFEIMITMMGHLYELNPFNQPGVELGKKLTKTYLQKK